MSDPAEPSQEILGWLTGLRLPQYAAAFQRCGYRALEDCGGLTEEQLLELRVFPTGHRRRILRGLEALGMVAEEVEEEDEKEGGFIKGRRKPVPRPRHVFPYRARASPHTQSLPTERSEGKGHEWAQSLPAGASLGPGSRVVDVGLLNRGTLQALKPTPRDPPYVPPSSSTSASSSSESLSEPPADGPSTSPPEPAPRRLEAPRPPPSTGGQPGFQGDMVENVIYQSAPRSRADRGPRPTRSYKLRHRPVPEIPEQTLLPSHDWHDFWGPRKQSGVVGGKSHQGEEWGRVLERGGTGHGGPEELLEKKTRARQKKTPPRKKCPKNKETWRGSDSSKGPVPPPAPTVLDLYEDDYSMVEECAVSYHPANHSWPSPAPGLPEPAAIGPADAGPASQSSSMVMVECDLYSPPFDALGGLVRTTLPLQADIAPYACFYGAPKFQRVKAGWLDKLSPQGKRVFQRRWVRFDGESLSYYNNEKEMYSKGLVPVGSMKQVKGQGDNRFEVVTSLRTFVFRTEREAERQEWVEVLQAALRSPAHPAASRFSKAAGAPTKCGPLELRGHKGRVVVSVAGPRVRLSKSQQDFKAGLAIAEVDLTDANIKDMDRRGFEINTPFKTFCFTADSEREKEEWTEALQEAVAETLCDYEVADKLWFNGPNRSCADCRAPRPEWASVNLGVVVCKKCAGQHRFLGSSLSKVRSLKMDSSIWTNELVELFLEVGNQKANSFWAANLPPAEELHAGATAEQRATFHRRKYRERKYRRVLEGLRSQEQLNQALCAAVVQPDVVETMALVFSGADVMCATGEADYSTPYLLAQRAGQRLQMEFLHHNKLSDFPLLEQSSESGCPFDAPSFMDGFLYVSPGPSKATLDRRGRDDMTRRWCTLEGGFFSYYESERSPVATGRVDISEVVSLAINNTETLIGAGAVFTVELHLQTERVLLFGAETHETQHDWVQAMAKCFVPAKVEGMLRQDSELIGRLYYKEGHDLYHWRVGWFTLVGSALHFSSGERQETQSFLQLKQLQELTVSTHPEGEEKVQVLLMVEGGRTVYVHGFTKGDFALWHSAIQLAAGTDGRALGNQQLSKNGVPIMVESCIAFVTQYGLIQVGLYQWQGDPARVAQLLEDFRRDARAVKLREGTQRLEDVCHALRSFLAQSEEALLAKELYPYWMSALDEEDEHQRVEKYFTFIQSLPKINRSTLAALLQHLYRVQRCSDIHHTPTRQLATVFSSCLFQTEGQTPQEITVVEDLINNYVSLFDVNEDQVQQMEKENSFITRWNDRRDTTFSPAGDLIFEVYLNRQEPENCCLIKLSPNMTAGEMVEKGLGMRSMAAAPGDLWTTFEVLENGELERPLHYNEKVLEQVLEWSTLDDPSTAFLVIKKFVGAKMAANWKDQHPHMKGDHLKCKDCSSKLLSGNKFQDRYVVLLADKLLLYKDMKNTKAEKEILLNSVKCYLGIRRKLKAPTSWGFTVHTEKQQWYFCCNAKDAQIDWVTSILRVRHGGDLWPTTKEPTRPALDKSYREGALSTSQESKPVKITPQQPAVQKRSLSISLSDTMARSSHDANLQPKTVRVANCLQPREALSVPNAGRRRASDGLCQPERCPSPRQTDPPSPVPPRAGGKNPARPARTGEALMPPDLLSELSSVLSKTGRCARKES
ncbi:arf-GAP with Rho-GAP domain, ANK repeat and PH domain-containing protein 2 [Aplochiton taeniatus]